MSSDYRSIYCADWDKIQQSIQSADAYVIHNQEEIARLNALESDRREKLRRIAEHNGQAIEDAANFLNVSFQANLARLSADIRAQIEASSASFSSQIEGTQPDFSSQIHAIRQQASAIGNRAAAANEAIESVARQYAEAFAKLAEQSNAKDKRAKLTLDEVDKLLEQIHELHPEVFAPTATVSLSSTRSSISASLSAGDYEAALIASQDAILRASRTLTELLVAREQYGAILSDVQKRLADIQVRADRLRSDNGEITVSIGGEEYEYPYDIRYWSSGVFDTVSAKIEGISSRVNGLFENPVSIDSLKRILGEIDTVADELDACDKESRDKLAGAIAVDNTAQRLNESISSRGWLLESSGRTDGDDRKPYSMVYHDGSGNKVTFVVSSGRTPENPDIFCEAFSKSKSMTDVVKSGVDATLKAGGLMPEGETVRRNDCSTNPTPEAFIRNITNEVTHSNSIRPSDSGYQSRV